MDNSLTSRVQIELEGVPLRTSLRLVVEQLGLSYFVKDGFIVISSPSVIRGLEGK